MLYSEASAQLVEFAEAFGIPIAETQAGKSAVSWDHPLNVGAIGVTGSITANRLAREADVVIGVGTRFSDFTTASRSAFQHPEASFININLNSMDAAKLGGEAILADAREGLQALQKELQERQYRSAYGTSEVADLRAEWNAEVDRLYAAQHEAGLAQTTTRSALLTGRLIHLPLLCVRQEVCQAIFISYGVAQNQETYHMEYGFSCMGYEVSGAFGAALPSRIVKYTP